VIAWGIEQPEPIDCGVTDCGNRRCEGGCDERMACTGPVPRACGTVCVDCPHDCQTCADQRADECADLLHKIAGEAS
jgi:hypothetical protein